MFDYARTLWHTNRTYKNILINTLAANIVITEIFGKGHRLGSFPVGLIRGRK